ncbi:helix-turn-helix domain-containing protein [Streptomyces milbemycinicus]|uniref:helix-turn-helix domain-containing protein n=1 Tax=Streptomyces milbemycinicus TaxID=476552 RepID=UPI0033DD6C9D
MAEPVRVRRLTDEEGRAPLRTVRRGRNSTVKVRHALIIMASASRNTNEAIAALVAADPDTVRDVIHAFNDRGLECLDPRWADGRPRRITTDDERRTSSTSLRSGPGGWACRSPTGEPAQARRLPQPSTGRGTPGDHRPRAAAGAAAPPPHLLRRTRTWQETHAPDADAKLDRIEEVTRPFPDRCVRLRPVRAAVD